MAHFNHYLSPVLLYIQEMFSPPITFDGRHTHPFYSPLIKTDGKLEAPNFNYNARPEKQRLNANPIWMSIANLLPPKPWSTRPLFLTILKVTVPSDSKHSFWDGTYVGYNWDTNLGDCPGTEFEVQRWGDTPSEANCNATLRAMDIIRYLRAHSTNPPCIKSCVEPTFFSDSDKSRGLVFARDLHNLWKRAHCAFMEENCKDSSFWRFAIATLHDYVSIYPEFRMLLKYYEVLTFVSLIAC